MDNSKKVTIPIFSKTNMSFDFIRFETICIDDIIKSSFVAISTYDIRIAKRVTWFGCTFKIPVFETFKVSCPHYQILVKSPSGVRVYKSVVDPYCTTGIGNMHWVGEVV